MDTIFGYKILKNTNVVVDEVYLKSAMRQYEIDLDREEAVQYFKTTTLSELVNKCRSDYIDAHVHELMTLLKEEEYILDNEFLSVFKVNIQKKQRLGFLTKDIGKTVGAVVENIVPFYNKKNQLFGVKIVASDRDIWIRFHGQIPTRNSVVVNLVDKIGGKRLPRMATVAGVQNVPMRDPNAIEIEIPEDVQTKPVAEQVPVDIEVPILVREPFKEELKAEGENETKKQKSNPQKRKAKEKNAS